MKKIVFLFIFICLFCSCNFNIIRELLGPSNSANNLVYEGEKALSEMRYAEAFDKFSEALSINPALSRARVGRVKARMGMQTSIETLARFAEKVRGRKYGEGGREIENGEPLILPSDFNFTNDSSGRGKFLSFAKDNFIDLYEVIFGFSDEEIPRNSPSINIDFSALALLTSVLVVHYKYPSFNAFWNDTLNSFVLNIANLNIPPEAEELGKSEYYLELGLFAIDSVIAQERAHSSWLDEYREILWRILQDVIFYRSL